MLAALICAISRGGRSIAIALLSHGLTIGSVARSVAALVGLGAGAWTTRCSSSPVTATA